jgi:ribosomal protein S18 acetylase RimI-like enzyme
MGVGLGMMVIDWPPYPTHPTQSARGYILNVFVEPERRGRGLARALMDPAMEEARQRGLVHTGSPEQRLATVAIDTISLSLTQRFG